MRPVPVGYAQRQSLGSASALFLQECSLEGEPDRRALPERDLRSKVPIIIIKVASIACRLIECEREDRDSRKVNLTFGLECANRFSAAPDAAEKKTSY